MTEHISDEYFVTREVVTYNGSALVSGEKDLVVEECYQLVVNGRGAGEITCSPWDKKEAFLGYLYLRGYISGAGDVRTIDVDEEHASQMVLRASKIIILGYSFSSADNYFCDKIGRAHV